MPGFEHPSFHYHASANALSGEFVRPVTKSIEAQAGVSLPLSGGHGQASAEDFCVDKRLSFRRAYCRVSGSKGPDKKHHSESAAVVEALNVLDVLTADRVVARLSSEHDPSKREGHILALGARFENLRISGCPVSVELDHELLLNAPKYADLSKQLAGGENSRRMVQESNGVIVCSLVKNVEADCPGISVQGHVIKVPHFGTIYVGEMIAEPGRRTLTMLRMELGSPDAGLLAIAQLDINGRPWP